MADTVEDEGLKKVAEIMELAPGDGAYTGVFQAILQVFGMAGSKNDPNAGAGTQGSEIQSTNKDPQSKEDHGHAAGIRRPTARDKKNAGE